MLGVIFFDVLNTFQSLGAPKPHKKNKYTVFSDLNIGPVTLKLPLENFLLVFRKTNFIVSQTTTALVGAFIQEKVS